jgi:hypothetical protein
MRIAYLYAYSNKLRLLWEGVLHHAYIVYILHVLNPRLITAANNYRYTYC